MINKTLGFAIVGGSALLTTAHTAFAQEFIQEVIVTAQKRQETLQTTPISISAFTADNMKARGITDFMGVAQNTPSISLSHYPTQSTELILYMRAQGLSDPGQITQDGSIGLYEDGFYIARPQFITFDLADIERVEVLRGPQGTLYGRNTTGGAVNIISKKPSGEFSFKEDVDVGNYNYFRSLTSINLPSWNGLDTKFTFVETREDGYIKNIGPSNDYGIDNQRAGRASLHWQNSDAFQVDYFFETARAETTPILWQTPSLNGVVLGYYGQPSVGPYYVPPDGPASRTWRPVDLPLSRNKFNMNGLTLTWNISDAFTIKSLTSYRDSSNDPYQDFSEAFSSPFSGGATTGFVVKDHYTDHQFTQELQFIGDVLDHRVKYVGGLYYFKEGGGHFENVPISVKSSLVPVPFGDFFEENDLRYVRAYSKSQAAYVQGTWTPPVLDDKFSITLGGRYTKDDKSAFRNFTQQFLTFGTELADLGATNKQHFTKFNPSATLAYNFNEDINAYLRYAQGYKAGGSSEAAAPFRFGVTFGPENVDSYELGIKAYEFDRHLRTNIAVFQNKFKNMQLAFQIDPTNLALGQVLNSATATVQGVELDVLFAPIQDLSFTGSYSYLDSKFDKVSVPPGTTLDSATNPLSPFSVGDDAKSLFALPYAPKNSFNVAADYTFLHLGDSALSLHLNYRWQDLVFETSPAGPGVPGRFLYALPSYGLMDGRITWAFDLKDNSKLRVALWSKNLTNKKYLEYTNGLGGGYVPTPGATTIGYTYQTQVWGRPRTFGLNLVYDY